MSIKKTKWHIHRYRVSTMLGIIHVYCVKCGAVTMRPRWPFWMYRKDNR